MMAVGTDEIPLHLARTMPRVAPVVPLDAKRAGLRTQIDLALSLSPPDYLAASLRARELADLDAPPVPPPWLAHVALCEASWFASPPPARDWLLRDNRTPQSDGVLPRGKVGLLIGEGGVSKTMALVQLAIAVATGTPWLGCYACESMGRVLLVLGEEDAEEVHRRAYNAARATRSPTPADGSIVVLPLSGVPCAMLDTDPAGNPVEAPFLAWLRSYVATNGPFDLVVIDPLSRFAGPEAEVDNAAATRFVQALESIATDTGAAVLVAHHTNKTARAAGAAVVASSARGSSAFSDGVRWVATLSSDRVPGADDLEPVTFTVSKSNYSKRGAPQTLRRDSSNGGALVPLGAVEEAAIASARTAADPVARRRSERDAYREEREAREAADREAREAAQTAAQAAREAAEDVALVEVLTARPRIPTRELRAEMRARLRCGHTACDDALARLGYRLVRCGGPSGSVLLSLREEK